MGGGGSRTERQKVTDVQRQAEMGSHAARDRQTDRQMAAWVPWDILTLMGRLRYPALGFHELTFLAKIPLWGEGGEG